MSRLYPSRGETRSSRQTTYLLQTPDTFVRTPMPVLRKGLAIVHASPALGAEFVWFTVELEVGGRLDPSRFNRFYYVLEGEGWVWAPGYEDWVGAGDYAFSPASTAFSLTAKTRLRCVVIDKRYEELHGYKAFEPFVGRGREVATEALNGDAAVQVGALMPSGFEADFAVNTMTYAAGAALAQVEIHYMEHGLLMLEGGGMYRLGEEMHQVREGDFIWMGPYCPQWFQADEDGPAKYLIYKNFNRVPAL